MSVTGWRSDPYLVRVFLSWIGYRAVLHRGWWLVASVYLVVDAGLSAAELVLIGVAQSLVALFCEIPTGVLADTVSRKWSLVVSQVLMGTAMLGTGLVTDFGWLVATQMLWGLSWTFASGADVAWITDELAQPDRISGVLVRAGRVELVGSAVGIAAIGTLAWLTQRGTAMVLAGAGMLALGLYVALRFPENQFVPRQSRSWRILVRGTALVRSSRAILVMLAGTLLVNGAAVGFGRLYNKRLIDLGLPVDPVLWFAGLGVVTLLVGAVALRAISRGVADLTGYAVVCGIGAVGVLGLAVAPEGVSGSVAVLVVAGIAMPLTRTIATIWVNQRTVGQVRATVHSFLAQAEYLGEIFCGLGIAAVAQAAGLSVALLCCAVLFLLSTIMILKNGMRSAAPPS